MIGTYAYEIPEPTDEEIQREIDAEGLTGITTPEEVKEHFRNSIYNMLSKAVKEQEDK